MVHYGCQWGDDISQTDTGYFPKKVAPGSILVPMLLASAEVCKMNYNPHELRAASLVTAATSSGSTAAGFKWPDGKTFNDPTDFETCQTDRDHDATCEKFIGGIAYDTDTSLVTSK